MTDPSSNSISGGTFFSAVIQGRNISMELPRQITPAMAGLPAASAAFTGRSRELDLLLTVLDPRNTPVRDTRDDRVTGSADAAPVTAVAGMGGIGKTELVVQAAHTALTRGWFAGGALFTDMFGYDPNRRRTIEQAATGFVRALGIPHKHIPTDSQEVLRLYQSVLAAYATQGRPVLVLINNVNHHQLATPLLPAHPACRAIVTSRHSLSRLDARLIDLDILRPREAVDVLRRALDLSRPGDRRITDHPDDAQQIASHCGFQPLALRLVAALLADNPKKPLKTVASELESQPNRLAELNYDEEGIVKVFDLSYRQLSMEQARLFRLLSVHPGLDISTAAAAALVNLLEIDTRRLLEALARSHLVEIGTAYGRWRMHDLIRLYSEYCREAETTAYDFAAAMTQLLEYYLSTMRAANSHLRMFTDGPRMAMFADSGDAWTWVNAESANLTACAKIKKPNSTHQTLVRELSDEIADAELSRLQWMWQDPIVHARLNLLFEVSFLDEPDRARKYNEYGVYLWEQQHFGEASWAYQEAALIYSDIGDRHGEGRSLSNHGMALTGAAMLGERSFEEASTALREAIKAFQDTDDRHSEGVTLSNLGIALKEWGKLEEAAAVWRSAAQILRDKGDHERLGVVMQMLEEVEQKMHELK